MNLNSIASSLRKLVWFVAIPSILFSIFVILVVAYAVKIEIDNAKFGETYEEKIEIVVAKTNLVAGTVLEWKNIGGMSIPKSELDENHHILAKDYFVILGHRLQKDIEYGNPISWYDTDIVITNKTSQQPDGLYKN